MRYLLIISLALLSVVGRGQGITFTRAELEAAADSALKGMQSVENEWELRGAIHHYVRSIHKYELAYQNCDSTVRAMSRLNSMLRTDVDDASDALFFEQKKTAKLRPWATIGRITVYGGIVALGFVAYQELAP